MATHEVEPDHQGLVPDELLERISLARESIDAQRAFIDTRERKIKGCETKADKAAEEIRVAQRETSEARRDASLDIVVSEPGDFYLQREAVESLYNDDPKQLALNAEVYRKIKESASLAGTIGVVGRVGISGFYNGVSRRSLPSHVGGVFGFTGDHHLTIAERHSNRTPTVHHQLIKGDIFGVTRNAMDASHNSDEHVLVEYGITTPTFIDPVELHSFLDRSLVDSPTFAVFGKEATTQLLRRMHQDVGLFGGRYPDANFNAADIMITASRLRIPIGDVAGGDLDTQKRFATEHAAKSVANRIGALIDEAEFKPSISSLSTSERKQRLKDVELPTSARPGNAILGDGSFRQALIAALTETLLIAVKDRDIDLGSLDRKPLLGKQMEGIEPLDAARLIEAELNCLDGFIDSGAAAVSAFKPEVLSELLIRAKQVRYTNGKRRATREINHQISLLDVSPIAVRDSVLA